mgnify:FL=1
MNILSAFQDRENLYLLLELMTGGDLRYHLIRNFIFTEEQTSKFLIRTIFANTMVIEFIVACIIVGLEYLHAHAILHRDIKPENLVFDERGNSSICYSPYHLTAKGYLRITDFGISKFWRPENSGDTSGTPGYMGKNLFAVVSS